MSGVVPTILFYLLLLTLVLGVLATATSLGVARLEAAHPPAGQFVEVDDVRLHVVVLEPTLEISETEPAIVLIHGASANLEDMRIALGEKLAATHRVILIDRPGHGWSTRSKDDDCSFPSRRRTRRGRLESSRCVAQSLSATPGRCVCGCLCARIPTGQPDLCSSCAHASLARQSR